MIGSKMIFVSSAKAREIRLFRIEISFKFNLQISLFTAVQQCMRLGMNLLSADDPAKNLSSLIAAVAGLVLLIFDLKNNVIMHIFIFIDSFPSLDDFWTSGANEGDFCNTEGVYGWCSNGKRVIKTNIQLTFLDLKKVIKPLDRCLALQSVNSALGLYHTPCSNTNEKTAICEVN
jgi:hypothetical protein